MYICTLNLQIGNSELKEICKDWEIIFCRYIVAWRCPNCSTNVIRCYFLAQNSSINIQCGLDRTSQDDVSGGFCDTPILNFSRSKGCYIGLCFDDPDYIRSL